MRNAIKNETKNVNKNSLFCSICNIFDLLTSRTDNLRTDTYLGDGCDISIFVNELISQILPIINITAGFVKKALINKNVLLDNNKSL